MAGIECATAEIRRGKEKDRNIEEEEDGRNHRAKI